MEKENTMKNSLARAYYEARKVKFPTIVVFDLDGTVIDSSHRHLSNPDGSVDLVHWRENCTPEKIFADRLLPLARSMRAIFAAGHHVVICTARVMAQADIDFLANNNLPYHGLLSRAEGDTRRDADMKVCLLNAYLLNKGFASIRDANCIMFDDNLKVLEAMAQQGVVCINATKENARRAA
jgi:phosphoglycolate phosphatase-like HAD superfamily hydrolase